jgi:hypothetical protein
MKILSSLAVAYLASSACAAFTPYRLSFDALTTKSLNDSEKASLLEALIETGMVSVTGLPAAAKQAAKDMGATQHACLVESDVTQEQTFKDGTVRRTLATHTVAGVGGMQPLKHAATSSEACAAFEEATKIFRKTTHQTVTAFAATLTELLDIQDGPLLVTESTESKAEPYSFATFSDVVEYGDRLEHFHSYQKTSESQQATIDVHTDQGLFLAFTPGRLTTGELTTGFFIQTAAGSLEQVEFTSEDEIALLLGDGVNQYVNDKLIRSKKLRAVPHAVQLQENADAARVWYGVMVLPPAAAVHPVHGVTFGQIRQGLIETGEVREEALRLACSYTVQDHRLLNDNATATNATTTTCENSDELYCWHQCMNVTTYQVSVEQCDAASLQLKCINPRGQISTGENHGDYYPGCAALDAEAETPFPTLPDYPRDDAACSAFDDFVEQGTYAKSVTLDDGDGAVFQYTVADGRVTGRLAFNGIFGYLAVGLAGTGDGNAMRSAHIIMALPASEYSASTGLDLTTDPMVNEYIINPDAFSFRFWDTPFTENSTTATSRGAGNVTRLLHESTYDVEFDGCYTALTFSAHAIANQDFSLDGTDKMIWAANNVDTFVQYHGDNHGIFEVDWSEGKTAPTNTTGDSSSTSTSGVTSIQTMAAILGAMLAAFF